MIQVEVVYALKEHQEIRQLQVDEGTTIEQVIQQSGLLNEYPEIDLNNNKVGIYNKVKPLTEVVRDGDRIEIYRPLIADPKEVRKRKALKKKK